jgi:hypothetical protein
MPPKAVPYVPTSWTGAYLGLTVGWGYLDGTVAGVFLAGPLLASDGAILAATAPE